MPDSRIGCCRVCSFALMSYCGLETLLLWTRKKMCEFSRPYLPVCRCWQGISHPMNTNPFPASFLNFKASLQLAPVLIPGRQTFLDWQMYLMTETHAVDYMRESMEGIMRFALLSEFLMSPSEYQAVDLLKHDYVSISVSNLLCMSSQPAIMGGVGLRFWIRADRWLPRCCANLSSLESWSYWEQSVDNCYVGGLQICSNSWQPEAYPQPPWKWPFSRRTTTASPRCRSRRRPPCCCASTCTAAWQVGAPSRTCLLSPLAPGLCGLSSALNLINDLQEPTYLIFYC